MEELFKLKRIDEAEGTRKIAGFLAFGAAAAQLIGLFLPVLVIAAVVLAVVLVRRKKKNK